MDVSPKVIQIKDRTKRLHITKPITKMDYTVKTILTNSSWEYVDLWLQRKNQRMALMYWKQAKSFYDASMLLPIESRPLTAYYCCMNAAKALLSVNSVSVNNIRHGVGSEIKDWNSNNTKDAIVKFYNSGILHELSLYFRETPSAEYSIYDLLYNTPCIHRAFIVTFRTPTELFIPIRDTSYYVNTETNDAWIQFLVDPEYNDSKILKKIPSTYEVPRCFKDSEECVLRCKKTFKWYHEPKDEEQRASNKTEISKYQPKIRKNIHYINVTMRLWYLKKELDSNSHVIDRNSITLIYAVFHWLSELVRYDPEKFYNLKSSNQYWLLHEFIETALNHYVDEISCEITASDIMMTGYRK